MHNNINIDGAAVDKDELVRQLKAQGFDVTIKAAFLPLSGNAMNSGLTAYERTSDPECVELRISDFDRGATRIYDKTRFLRLMAQMERIKSERNW